MTTKTAVSRLALIAIAVLAVVLAALLGLSYYDVRQSVGTKGVTLVSIAPHRTHFLQLRWRMGAYDPDHDMPGQYVYWTLRPRKVTFVK